APPGISARSSPLNLSGMVALLLPRPIAPEPITQLRRFPAQLAKLVLLGPNAALLLLQLPSLRRDRPLPILYFAEQYRAQLLVANSLGLPGAVPDDEFRIDLGDLLRAKTILQLPAGIALQMESHCPQAAQLCGA